MWRSGALLMRENGPSFFYEHGQSSRRFYYLYIQGCLPCLSWNSFFNEKNKQRGQMIILASQTDIYFKVFDSMKITC